MRTKIIYEDAQLLVCHKPAGLATQSGHIGQADVVSELKKHLARSMWKEAPIRETMKVSRSKYERSAEPYLGIIHRLDQPVEGLLVFAKTKDAAAKLTAQLSQGSLNKQYYAVVCGKPSTEAGELVDYLLKEKDMARVSEKGAVDKEAKKAILRFQQVSETMTEVSGEPQAISLLDIHIETGRFHQIRVQMSHAGLPLLGDLKYGSAQSLEISEKLGIRNVALYAYRVEFKHPKTGKRLEFQIQPDLPCGFGNIS